MQSDGNDATCDDIIGISKLKLTENPEPSKTAKKRRNSSVVQILDEVDESLSYFSSGKEVQRNDEVQTKKIQAIISKLILQFGDKSKLQASVLSPVVAWQDLCQILEISSHGNQDFYPVRSIVVLSGGINLAFDCLSYYTHCFLEKSDTEVHLKPKMSTSEKIKLPKLNNVQRDLPSQSNGIGFSTGKTFNTWNHNEYLEKQISEEKHITVLFQVFACYINPQDKILSGTQALPALFIDILEQSCLVTVLLSYLRNDSVLDMTQHIPLYRAISLLIRAISTCNQLAHLLILKHKRSNDSIADLLSNIKSSTDFFKFKLHGAFDEDTELYMFIEEVQKTSCLVESATSVFVETKQSFNQPQTQLVDQKYVEVMKKLQFDSFEMIKNNDNFTVAYHFKRLSLSCDTRGSAGRIKRLAKEYASLANSLPLSFSSSIFVRSDNSRMDIMKCLITGPVNTPYENGCFVFDFYFPLEYPKIPPLVNSETTGQNSVRFNPNLYECGKVCLSLLNTWNGSPQEHWNADTSSLLQLLVSIQSLILVEDPYFNEPQYETFRGPTDEYWVQRSNKYNHALYPSTIKWGMIDHMRNPTSCFKEVIQKHFWLKRNEIMQQVDRWAKDVPKINSLKVQLAEEFLKLPVPQGMENFVIDTPEMNRKN